MWGLVEGSEWRRCLGLSFEQGQGAATPRACVLESHSTLGGGGEIRISAFRFLLGATRPTWSHSQIIRCFQNAIFLEQTHSFQHVNYSDNQAGHRIVFFLHKLQLIKPGGHLGIIQFNLLVFKYLELKHMKVKVTCCTNVDLESRSLACTSVFESNCFLPKGILLVKITWSHQSWR